MAEPKLGIVLAFVCLSILGVMPIISNGRPAEFDALSFAVMLSVWQLVFSVPLMIRDSGPAHGGIFDAELEADRKRRTLAIILVTGAIFGVATYVYVLAVEKAGAVSAAIAIQAYPLFAILWETLFLRRRKSQAELAFTFLLIGAMVFLATGGTWQIEGISLWFLLALGIPFLWSVAHVIIKEVLDRTPITPGQVTFFRVLISSVLLGVAWIVVAGPDRILHDVGNLRFQAFAAVMGLVYYLELILWFHAVRHIDVSLASSITVPAPALTMVLAILFLEESVAGYQVAALVIVIACVYALLIAGSRKRSAAVRLAVKGERPPEGSSRRHPS